MGHENISNFQRKVPVPLSKIRRAVASACRKLKLKTEPSVAFVGERRMRRLNKEYLGHDYVTDVLTFEGEIIICPAVAVRNARRYGNSVERELVLYVIHGILHLCGYDDHSPQDIKRMRQKERELLA